jgi:hypothetical protein
MKLFSWFYKMDQYEIQQIGCSVCQQSQNRIEEEERKYRDQLEGRTVKQDVDEQKSSMNWLWIALIILLILLVIYFVMRKKKINTPRITSPRRR